MKRPSPFSERSTQQPPHSVSIIDDTTTVAKQVKGISFVVSSLDGKDVDEGVTVDVVESTVSPGTMVPIIHTKSNYVSHYDFVFDEQGRFVNSARGKRVLIQTMPLAGDSNKYDDGNITVTGSGDLGMDGKSFETVFE